MHPTGDARRGPDVLRAAFEQRGDEAWAMFEELFRASPVGLAFFDRGLRYVRLNDTLARLNGRTVEEHLGRRVDDVLPTLGRLMTTVLQRVLASGEPILDLEISTPFGTGRTVLASFHPIRADGEVLGVGVAVTDITERRRTEDQLRAANARIEELLEREKRARAAAESEHQRLFALLENAPVPISVVRGPEFRFTYANALCRATEAGADYSGRPFAEVLPHYAALGGVQALQAVLATGKGLVLEEITVAMPGTDVSGSTFNVILEPLRAPDGTVDSVLIMGAEVTRQVRARRRAEDAEVRIRTLADAIPHDIWIGREDGSVEFHNSRTFSDANQDRVHPDDFEKLVAAVAPALQEGRGYEVEIRLRNDAGEYRWHILRAVPFHPGPGEPLRWFGTSTDVHQAHLDRQALADREARFRAVVENASIGIYFVSLDGRISSANDAFLRLLGYDRSDISSARICWGKVAGVGPGGGPPPHVREALETKGAFDPYEREYVHKDGTRIPVVVSGASLGPSRELVVFVIDLREQKDAERRQQAFRDLIVGMVGHDLRNPLAAILTSATLLDRRGELIERDRRVTRRIVSAAERMTRMISQLLDLTRVRLGGGIPIVRAPMDLHELVRRVTEELVASWPDRRIDLALTGEGTGAWDADRLGQVVSNLLGNALEHGSAEHPVTVEAEDVEAGVRLRVRNHGTPIPAETLPVIFDPFTSDPRRRARSSSSGLGLGLYIGRQIVAGHGGSIDVESSPDGITTFTVVLPRR